MAKCSNNTNISFEELTSGKVCKPCFNTENKMEKMKVMIKGYQDMAEINLKISKLCFEVESEADEFCYQLTECD